MLVLHNLYWRFCSLKREHISNQYFCFHLWLSFLPSVSYSLVPSFSPLHFLAGKERKGWRVGSFPFDATAAESYIAAVHNLHTHTRHSCRKTREEEELNDANGFFSGESVVPKNIRFSRRGRSSEWLFFSFPPFFEISKACIWELGNSRDVGKLRSKISLGATNGSDADEWDLVLVRMCVRHWMGVNSGVRCCMHMRRIPTQTHNICTHGRINFLLAPRLEKAAIFRPYAHPPG